MAHTTDENTVKRSSANYHPTIWGGHFISFSPHYLNKEDEAASLKEKVREKLILVTKSGLTDQLQLIDVIERLGIAYHFEPEIHQLLKQISDHNHHHQEDDDDENQLLVSALKFRLLRQHGYNAPSDVFKKFKDGENRFKEAWDVQELLALYEATYLRVHGEEILEEALEFTKIKLQEMVPHLKPSLAKHVLNALYRPMRKSLPRMYAREFISFYQQDEFHDQVLLRFAKLDFNILQKQHQQELSIISKWWASLEVEVNFPFARDRVAEGYFWVLGVFYEPQYSLARKFLAKVLSMLSIIDDIYDVYGTHEELHLFTLAIQRWEIDNGTLEELPDYMKICYQALPQVYDEMEKEFTGLGMSFAIHYAKEATKGAVKTYYEESKWLLQGKKTLRMEEYMKIAVDTTCYPLIALISIIGMGEIATKQVLDWVMAKPPILQAAAVICRLMDDMVSHQREQEREHVPSAVECYMHEHGVSEEAACVELNKQVEDAWKTMNQDVIDAQLPPMAVAMTLLTRILNLARVMEFMYKEEDGYTNATTTTKDYIVSMFVDPIEI